MGLLNVCLKSFTAQQRSYRGSMRPPSWYLLEGGLPRIIEHVVSEGGGSRPKTSASLITLTVLGGS